LIGVAAGVSIAATTLVVRAVAAVGVLRCLLVLWIWLLLGLLGGLLLLLLLLLLFLSSFLFVLTARRSKHVPRGLLLRVLLAQPPVLLEEDAISVRSSAEKRGGRGGRQPLCPFVGSFS
jgi:hypothetical protein